MSRLEGKDDMEKLKKLNSKPYKEQAQWFLNWRWNTFFKDNQAERLNMFQFASQMAELDQKGGAKGNELNEFDAHRFLEKNGETLTVKEMREKLRQIDIDFNKMVSLTEYLVVRYKIDWRDLVNAILGQNTDEIDKARSMVDAAEKALALSISRAQEAEKAEKEQLVAENELRRALKQLEDEEKAYKDAMAALEERKGDSKLGIVQRNKAANELEQLKAKDPLPLQRAKINQSAAVRKAERATAAAQAARAEAEKTLEAAQEAFDAAQKYLNEVSSRAGSCEGSVWWLQHELEENRKYLPQSKGGVRKP